MLLRRTLNLGLLTVVVIACHLDLLTMIIIAHDLGLFAMVVIACHCIFLKVVVIAPDHGFCKEDTGEKM